VKTSASVKESGNAGVYGNIVSWCGLQIHATQYTLAYRSPL